MKVGNRLTDGGELRSSSIGPASSVLSGPMLVNERKSMLIALYPRFSAPRLQSDAKSRARAAITGEAKGNKGMNQTHLIFLIFIGIVSEWLRLVWSER